MDIELIKKQIETIEHQLNVLKVLINDDSVIETNKTIKEETNDSLLEMDFKAFVEKYKYDMEKRTYNCLIWEYYKQIKENNSFKLKDFLQKKENDLYQIGGFGKVSVKDIKFLLKKIGGFSFKGEK